MANGVAGGGSAGTDLHLAYAVACAGFGPLFWVLGFSHFGFRPNSRRPLSLKLMPERKKKKAFYIHKLWAQSDLER
jgi:hypothetical protein